MKDKLKTRFSEFIHDKRVQGIFIGGVAGIASTLITAKVVHLNFSDPDGTLHIPDHIVDDILRTGLPVMLDRHDGVQLSLGPS